MMTRPTTPPNPEDLKHIARRARDTVDAGLTLFGRVLGHVERLVTDVVRDSQAVATETTAMWRLLNQRAADVSGAVRSSPRFARVMAETARIVAAYRVHKGRAEILPPERADEALQKLHRANARRVHDLCVELGGGMLKLGQFASCRMDILPAPWIEELAALQDQVPPVPFEEARAVVEADLGAPLAEVFTSFDQTALAAASLAQVHAAELPDGRRVAVKIQRPGVAETIETDIAAMRIAASVLAEALPGVDIRTTIAQLSASLREELDFAREATNLETFASRLDERTPVSVPSVVRTLTTRRVLTLSMLEGSGLTDYLNNATPEDRDQLLIRMAEAVAAQLFVYGLLHADPHPGNFMVLEGGRLGILDFGAVQAYTDAERRGYAELVGAVIRRDPTKIAEKLATLGFQADDPCALVTLSEAMLGPFVIGGEVDWDALDPQQEVMRALELLKQHPVTIPPHFVQLGRVLTAVSGLFMAYKPKVDLVRIVMPAMAKALATTG